MDRNSGKGKSIARSFSDMDWESQDQHPSSSLHSTPMMPMPTRTSARHSRSRGLGSYLGSLGSDGTLDPIDEEQRSNNETSSGAGAVKRGGRGGGESSRAGASRTSQTTTSTTSHSTTASPSTTTSSSQLFPSTALIDWGRVISISPWEGNPQSSSSSSSFFYINQGTRRRAIPTSSLYTRCRGYVGQARVVYTDKYKDKDKNPQPLCTYACHMCVAEVEWNLGLRRRNPRG